MIIWELLAEATPFAQLKEEVMGNQFELLQKIHKENVRPPLEDIPDLYAYPDDLVTLMRQCWQREPSLRPQSFDEITDAMLDIIQQNVTGKNLKKRTLIRKKSKRKKKLKIPRAPRGKAPDSFGGDTSESASSGVSDTESEHDESEEGEEGEGKDSGDEDEGPTEPEPAGTGAKRPISLGDPLSLGQEW